MNRNNKAIGYIYIRDHESYKKYNIYKLGKTTNIPERESTYITSEYIRGKFIKVFEVDYKILDQLEIDLIKHFKELWKYDKENGGGKEFFDIKILDRIEPYLIENKVEYKLLSDDEISNLIRKQRETESEKKDEMIKPREDQEEIITKLVNYFRENDKALLILMCGVGKTLISLWTVERLKQSKILIGVPNILLLNQWNSEIKRIFNKETLLVKSGIKTKDIKEFLKTNEECIVITSYSSSLKVLKACEKINYTFDIKINDECHHLTSFNYDMLDKVSDDENKKFVDILKIKSDKQISLTATCKNIESLDSSNKIVSNDNKEIFGDIVDQKTFLWAINKKIICDYVIQTIITDEEEMNKNFIKLKINNNEDKRLFLSAYSSLKSIIDANTHHILIYANSQEKAEKINEYIKILLENKYFEINDIYYNSYYSNLKTIRQKEILDEYNKSKYGIISCVYCLGEGYDNKRIDGVVFAENMSSNIRIIQSALRAARKNPLEPEKITKIILPILNLKDFMKDGVDSNNSDFLKIREIVYQIGKEDETIMTKLKVYKISKSTCGAPSTIQKPSVEFGEFDEELTKKLRLMTIPRDRLNITYEEAKKIIKNKLIDKTKEGYYQLCENDIRLSKEPDVIFKESFASWIDYLGLERIYYDLKTCKNKINEYLLKYSNLKKDYLELYKISSELCKIDPLFPPSGLWIEYYSVKDLQDIINIKNNKKKKGVIL
jgi:predicted helicase